METWDWCQIPRKSLGFFNISLLLENFLELSDIVFTVLLSPHRAGLKIIITLSFINYFVFEQTIRKAEKRVSCRFFVVFSIEQSKSSRCYFSNHRSLYDYLDRPNTENISQNLRRHFERGSAACSRARWVLTSAPHLVPWSLPGPRPRSELTLSPRRQSLTLRRPIISGYHVEGGGGGGAANDGDAPMRAL